MPETVVQIKDWLSLIILVWSVATIAKTISKASKEPNELQDKRISKLEVRVDKIDDKLMSDYLRINQLEEGNKIIQRCLLEMMNQMINGHNEDKLTKARDDLQSYLIEGMTTTKRDISRRTTGRMPDSQNFPDDKN